MNEHAWVSMKEHAWASCTHAHDAGRGTGPRWRLAPGSQWMNMPGSHVPTHTIQDAGVSSTHAHDAGREAGPRWRLAPATGSVPLGPCTKAQDSETCRYTRPFALGAGCLQWACRPALTACPCDGQRSCSSQQSDFLLWRYLDFHIS